MTTPSSELTSLLRMSGKLNATFDLNTLLDTLVDEALELTGAESGCAGLRTAKGMSCGSFRQGGVTIAPEVRERFQVTSGMSIPIVDGRNDTIAFFEIYNKKSGAEFTPQDLTNSLAAAQIASLAIQNGLTHGKLIALAAFSRSLSLTGDLEQILEVVGRHLETNFHRGSVILLPSDGCLVLRYKTPGFVSTSTEVEAAAWCWQHGTEAGASTANVPDAHFCYLPLTVREQVTGVLGLQSRPGALSSPERELLTGILAQSSLAIERAILEQKLSRLRFLDESERVQSALLTAVAHEVRAPLAAITAAVSALSSTTVPLDEGTRRQLLRTAEYEAKRLHRLMNNLLDVTRIEAGVWRIRMEPCDLSDVVAAALEELGISVHDRQVVIEIPPDLPLVPMDFELIVQVLVNLLSNAMKFSPLDSAIHLRTRMVESQLEITVADGGAGIPEEDLDRVFQKFLRLAETSSADGLGLGLSICKQFIEAHRGRIALEHNPEGGTIARFVLPVS